MVKICTWKDYINKHPSQTGQVLLPWLQRVPRGHRVWTVSGFIPAGDIWCMSYFSLSLSLYTCQYPIKGKKCHKNKVAASLFEDNELICQSETFTSCEACLTLTYHHTWEVSSKTVKVLTPSSEFLLTFCLPFFVFSLKITCIRTFPFSCKAAIFICTEIKLQRDKNWRWPNVESPRGFGLGFLVPLKTTVFFRLCVSRLCLSLSSSIMRVPVHSSSINKWFSQFGVEAHSPDLNPIRHL